MLGTDFDGNNEHEDNVSEDALYQEGYDYSLANRLTKTLGNLAGCMLCCAGSASSLYEGSLVGVFFAGYAGEKLSRGVAQTADFCCPPTPLVAEPMQMELPTTERDSKKLR